MQSDTSLNRFINQVKESKWYRGSIWEFDWYLTVFFVEVYALGKNPVFTGLSMPVIGSEFLDNKDADKAIGLFRGKFKSDKWLNKLIDKQNVILTSSNSLLRQFRKSKNIDLSEYEKVQKYLSQLMSSVSGIFDHLISEGVSEIASKSKINEHDIVDYIVAKSSHTELNKSNNQLSSVYKRNKSEFDRSKFEYNKLGKSTRSILKKHSDDYGWINTGERGKKPWTASDFLKQMKNLTKIKPKKTTQPKLSVEYKKRIQLYLQVNRNDNLAADHQVELDYCFQNFLKDKLGEYYVEETLERLTFDEILEVLDKPKLISKYKKSRNSENRIAWTEGKQLECHYLDNKQQPEDILNTIPHKQSTNVIDGTVACRGFVKGKVRLIERLSDLNKFEKGEIMIAVKTQPSYVPYMVKAAAIVTDVGGVTSHAAIISREFEIPSIVGTLNATKVLENGDYVLVDAEEGVVTKLNVD